MHSALLSPQCPITLPLSAHHTPSIPLSQLFLPISISDPEFFSTFPVQCLVIILRNKMIFRGFLLVNISFVMTFAIYITAPDEYHIVRMSLLYFHCHFSIYPLRLLFPFLSCSSYSSPDVDHIVRMSPAVILHPLFAAAPPLFPGLTSLCCLITSLPPHISFLISHRCLSHATRVFLDKRLLSKTLQWEGKGLRLRGQRNLEGKKLPKMLFFFPSIFEQIPAGLDSFYSFMGRLVRFRWTNRFSPSDCL